MYSDYNSDQQLAGLKIALETPESMQFLSTKKALFYTDERVYILTLNDFFKQWECDCDHFQTIWRSGHPAPFCLHTVAIERILRGTPEHIHWLHKNIHVDPLRQHEVLIDEYAFA
jgi:hypothetical protein